jgi:hypothetical protein
MVRTARARADGRLIMTDLLEGIVNVIVIVIGDSIVIGTDNDDVYRHHNVHRPRLHDPTMTTTHDDDDDDDDDDDHDHDHGRPGSRPPRSALSSSP